MFPSQMVRLKNVEPSSGSLFTCFPRKWYELKSNPQVAHFVLPRKWYALKLCQVAHACFNRKWYALKLSNPQVAHFVHVSLANSTS